jgi:hypothetical protein
VGRPDDPSREQIEMRLEELFARVMRMPNEDLAVLRGTWNDADERLRTDAWRNVKLALDLRDRTDILETTRARMAAWAFGQRGGFEVNYGTLMGANPMDGADIRREALPPLLDAVAAIIAADSLTADDRRVLLEPLDAISTPHEQA